VQGNYSICKKRQQTALGNVM